MHPGIPGTPGGPNLFPFPGTTCREFPDTSHQNYFNTQTNESFSNAEKLHNVQIYHREVLEFLYQALMTIPLTSVKAERAFPIAGNFITRIRSRHGDGCMSDLVFFSKGIYNKIDTQMSIVASVAQWLVRGRYRFQFPIGHNGSM